MLSNIIILDFVSTAIVAHPLKLEFISIYINRIYVETITLLQRKDIDDRLKCSRPNTLHGNCLNSQNENNAQ